MSRVLRFAWFRFRASLGQRAAGYVSVVLVIGTVGGIAIASLAGARRTESSFPTYVASTNPSTIRLFTRYLDPTIGFQTGYDPRLSDEIAHLPLVRRSATALIFDANIDIPSIVGARLTLGAGAAPPAFVGSPDGEYTSMDDVKLVAGRMPVPGRADEAVLNAQAAKELRVHIGSVIRIPMYTDAQVLSPATPTHHLVVPVKFVGEIVNPSEVIESDANALNSADVIFSPALTRELSHQYATGTQTYLQLAGGDRAAKRVLAEIYALDPPAVHFPEGITTAFLPSVQQAITPEAVALGVFGGITMLAVLLIAGLMIGRMLRARGSDLETLRAVGAGRSMLLGDELAGLVAAILLGSLLAAGIAVALSPLTPLGPVRSVYPYLGIAVDWTATGLGLLTLIAILGLVAVFIAHREVQRVASHDPRHRVRESRVAASASRAGLPVSAQTGIRFAVDPGPTHNAVPVRSAMFGAVLAVAVLTAAVTFGSSLDSLVSHPPLYGWNWDYAVVSGFAGAEDLPAHQIAVFLNRDHDVKAWSGVNLLTAKLDGKRTQVLAEAPNSTVAPPVLSGHGLAASNEVVLSAPTLASLHKRIGDTVTLSTGLTPPRTLIVVGTASMPDIASGGGGGQTALAATSDFPAPLLNLQSSQVPGPNVVFVRIRPGVARAAAYKSLSEVVNEVNAYPPSAGLGGGVIRVLRPVEIVNFRSMGMTPSILSAGLAAGAIAALGLTLAASVRQRRRDLALLKTLGFTRRQLAESIAWQATMAAVVGVAIGMPLGIVIGRQLWLYFARTNNVVPVATVPAVSMLLVFVGAVLFANMVAAIPGRAAARTPTAIVLRAE